MNEISKHEKSWFVISYNLEAIAKPLFIFGKPETDCDTFLGGSTKTFVNHPKCDEDTEIEKAFIFIVNLSTYVAFHT